MHVSDEKETRKLKVALVPTVARSVTFLALNRGTVAGLKDATKQVSGLYDQVMT